MGIGLDLAVGGVDVFSGGVLVLVLIVFLWHWWSTRCWCDVGFDVDRVFVELVSLVGVWLVLVLCRCGCY